VIQKRVFLDIDSVLTCSDTKSGIDTLLSLERAIEHATIGIATARDFPGIRELYESINRNDLCIVENGAVVIQGETIYYPVDIRKTLSKIFELLINTPGLDINFYDSHLEGRCNSMRINCLSEKELGIVTEICMDLSHVLDTVRAGMDIYIYPKGISKMQVLACLAKDRIYLISDNEENVCKNTTVSVICVGDSSCHPDPLLIVSTIGEEEIGQIAKAIRDDKAGTHYSTSEFAGVKYYQKWITQDAFYECFVTQIYGYVVDDKGKVAIVKTKHGWQLPGGKPEPGESFVQTLTREVAEECNCEIVDPIQLGFIKVFREELWAPIIQLRFICKLKNQLDDLLRFETDQVLFVSPPELETYFPWFNTPNYIEEYACFMAKLLKIK
jgi:hydroxymethylpyrimidine pyrophosphatase-like HAD family hydrolase/8-oxo-dGTP pyrophosphatase MutT (NUDIX family)